MPDPRAVVLPFGVPPPMSGLGVGAAALLHAFFHVGGERVAFVQVLARPKDRDDEPHAVEALIPSQAWKDMPGSDDAPESVVTVITGAIEAPHEGKGAVHLVAFDRRTLDIRFRTDAPFDDEDAGRVLVRAFRELAEALAGDMTALSDLESATWDALVSVLHAERCCLVDPKHGDARDRTAAIVHLARAIADAPQCRYPAGRLAALALDTAVRPGIDKRLVETALRVLIGTVEDAPNHPELLEATSVLHLRAGDAANAEVYASRALGLAPERGRVHALVSEARRMLGNVAGAADAIHRGKAHAPDDYVLLTEEGAVLAIQGDALGARASWERALGVAPGFPPAYTNLALLAGREQDPLLAGRLVDHALALRQAPLDCLRHAIQLALAAEAPGLARSARLATLCRSFLAQAPEGEQALRLLATSLHELGDREEARAIEARLAAKAPPPVHLSFMDRLLGRR
ncbi:hypothetical protein BH09MYX1_BH09MYX1_05240 [soil metagenome]